MVVQVEILFFQPLHHLVVVAVKDKLVVVFLAVLVVAPVVSVFKEQEPAVLVTAVDIRLSKDTKVVTKAEETLVLAVVVVHPQQVKTETRVVLLGQMETAEQGLLLALLVLLLPEQVVVEVEVTVTLQFAKV
jgi:hypothetical protein